MLETKRLEDQTQARTLTSGEPIEKAPPPSPDKKWPIEGATRTGQIRSENQDAFSVGVNVQGFQFAVLCDGAGGHVGGGEASQTAVEMIAVYLKTASLSDAAPIEILLAAIEETRDYFTLSELDGITTAILTIIDGEYIHYATLGDGALVAIFPDGMTTQIQTPHHLLGQPSNIIGAYIGQECEVAPRVGSLRVEEGTTVMLMSDGASDLFPYEDFAQNHDAYIEYLEAEKTPSLSNHILDQIEQARDPETGAYLHHDNMTLVIAHFPKPPAHISLAEALEEVDND